MTRESYEVVAGHQRVYDRVVEDLAIAQEYARAGRRRVLATALDDMTTRMYTSLGEIYEGWTKNVFIALRQSLPRPEAVYLLIPLMLLMPVLWLAPPLVLALGLAVGFPAMAAFGLLVATGSLACWPVVYRYTRTPLRYAPLYPLGVILMGSIFLRATWRGSRKIEWKGRVYASDQ